MPKFGRKGLSASEYYSAPGWEGIEVLQGKARELLALLEGSPHKDQVRALCDTIQLERDAPRAARMVAALEFRLSIKNQTQIPAELQAQAQQALNEFKTELFRQKPDAEDAYKKHPAEQFVPTTETEIEEYRSRMSRALSGRRTR